jgi:predicted nucleic acid-binding protein
MNVYLDTSALVKLYVDEKGTPVVRSITQDARLVSTSAISYVEARAAFARRQREGCFSRAELDRIIRDLDRDWEGYVLVQVTDPVIRRAAALSEVRRLRAYDSIHLGSACMINDRLSDPLVFASWDVGLNRAAADEGLEVLELQ